MSIADVVKGNGASSVQFEAQGLPANFEDGGSTPFGESILTAWHQIDPDIPNWWSRSRDYFLRKYMRSGDDLTRGAIYGEVTRVKNMPWRIKALEQSDEEKLQDEITLYTNILKSANFGSGFSQMGATSCLEYLSQDNGFFTELMPVGDSKHQPAPKTDEFPAGGWIADSIEGEPVGGIAHIDSRQCWRTFDREWPVIYVNSYTGQYTILHWTRVNKASNFTQPDEQGRDIGFCALSRIFRAGRIIKNMQDYYQEKITGAGADIGLGSGVTEAQYKRAKDDAQWVEQQRGNKVYRPINWIFGLNPTMKPSLETFSLKGLPDGFDHLTEIEIAVNIIATSLGVDVNEIWKLRGGGLSDKGQAEVTHKMASRKGRDDFLRMMEQIITDRVLPEGLILEYDQKDDEQDKTREEIKSMRVKTRETQLSNGEIDINEARQMAASDGDIPAEFLESRPLAETTDDEPPEIDDDDVMEADEPEEITEEKHLKKKVNRC